MLQAGKNEIQSAEDAVEAFRGMVDSSTAILTVLKSTNDTAAGVGSAIFKATAVATAATRQALIAAAEADHSANSAALREASEVLAALKV